MEKPREGEKLNTDYNQLLKQIQNLSELQSNGTIQNADPSIQVTKQNLNNDYDFFSYFRLPMWPDCSNKQLKSNNC